MLSRISLSLAAVCLWLSPISAAVPQLLNYQGRLTNTSGVPLDTTVSMVFTIYDAPGGGVAQWTETQNSITVTDGVFNVLLGSVAALHDSVFRAANRYLGIRVGNDLEMEPRTRLVSVGYSHRVATVDGAAGGAITSQIAIGPGHETSGSQAFVAGESNAATGDHATVSGGANNKARGAYAAVGGGGAATPGDSNLALGDYSVIGGGWRHLTTGQYSTIGGGDDQTANGDWSVISGGQDNAATANFGTVAGGQFNLATGAYATIAGGTRAVAGGDYSFVAGGTDNTTNGNYSFAAGRFATVAGTHGGALLLADSTGIPFQSAAANEFAVRCTGGARIITAVDLVGVPTAGVCLTAGGGSWSSCSDRNVKENVSVVDGEEILAKVAELQVSAWNYKTEPDSIRHIGPMAQDFRRAFKVGADERYITAIDADGIALAAIQELHRRMSAELAAKDHALAVLETEVSELRALVNGLLEKRSNSGKL